MGRPAPPRSLRLLRGDKVGDREPVPTAAAQPDPLWSPGAREVWDRIGPDMVARGVLTAWDMPLFTELIEGLVLARLYRARMSRELTGEVELRPGEVAAVYSYRALMVLVNTAASQFGLNPAARSRLFADVVESGSRGDATSKYLDS